MHKIDTSTPVVVLSCKLAALGIMRSLGSLGVELYGVDSSRSVPGLMSRYCKKAFIIDLDGKNPVSAIKDLKAVASEIGRRAVLIPTSDETTTLVEEYADELREHFIFPQNTRDLLKRLADKRDMSVLAVEHGLTGPRTEFPQSIADVLKYAERSAFPVMLKGIHGNLLQERTGLKMLRVDSREDLLDAYRWMEDPDSPNLMLQEYIPGDDDQIYIFNGYFDKDSNCLAAFTGHKLRQFPIHVGCASLGICAWNDTVAKITIDFMKKIGYSGILDIGYRYDARDGKYKVLDINPRIGQAFRLFLDEDGMEVARTLYLDLTGQETPPVRPREGRRWLIEDFDLISSFHYYKEGSLGVYEWLKSFRGVEEAAWFSLRDPAPFFMMFKMLLKKTALWCGKKVLNRQKPQAGRIKEY